MQKIIVISGYLAAGKSTFANKLSDVFHIPCFIKDTFKIALCKNMEIDSRAEKSRFSVVTFDAMMYVAEQMMKCGCPLIIEGNFLPAGIKKTDEAGEIQALINKYGYSSLNFKFVGDTNILYRRFVEREMSDERGAVNKVGDISYEHFDKICHNMDAFDVGGTNICIDTTDFDKVDFTEYVRCVDKFLNKDIYA